MIDRSLWQKLLKRISRRTGTQDAEDLLHAAFVRLETYRRQHVVENASAFLVRTAVNLAIDQKRHSKFTDDAAFERAAAEFVDPAPLQDEVNLARIRLGRVRDGLDRLPSRTRQIFLMHRVEGLKYREIAQQLGISQSAVEKQIAKAALFLSEWTAGW